MKTFLYRHWLIIFIRSSISFLLGNWVDILKEPKSRRTNWSSISVTQSGMKPGFTGTNSHNPWSNIIKDIESDGFFGREKQFREFSFLLCCFQLYNKPSWLIVIFLSFPSLPETSNLSFVMPFQARLLSRHIFYKLSEIFLAEWIYRICVMLLLTMKLSYPKIHGHHFKLHQKVGLLFRGSAFKQERYYSSQEWQECKSLSLQSFSI